MMDINKYLATQHALTKQAFDIKNSKKETVSKSKAPAHSTKSKKKNKNPSKKYKSDIQLGELSQNATLTKVSCEDIESDEEYLPSEEEIDNEISISRTSSSRTKLKLKKIIDDGDQNHYNLRIKRSKENQVAAYSGNYKGDIVSADIKYIMDGKKEFDKKRELRNGLSIPNYIWKQLYKHQKVGIKWLWELHQMQSGGLLGDEMGLGKTTQIIAFLAALSNSDIGKWSGLGPSIIVAPATIIYQWVSHFHYNKLIKDVHQYRGILVMTYAGIVKYSNYILAKKWHYIILDEGHKIRNPNTQVSKIIKQIDTPHRIIVTGSPLQNNLQELWSIFDFIIPGLLGACNAFMEHFVVPITQGGYANSTQLQQTIALEIAKALKNIITPYILRRTKAEVQDNIKLPEKNEQVLFCALSQEQRDLYINYLKSNTVRRIKNYKFSDPLRARILIALSTLRKICNHPDLYLNKAQQNIRDVDINENGHWKRSGKMNVVNSLLKIWQKQGHRVLIFSQSRAMVSILENYLQGQHYKYLKIDGSVSVNQRQNLIKIFNETSEYFVFLSTTRVGGLGVNLTGADRVIIYDPDWNPATDNQATERAWRIGQEKNVTVYRLLSAGTIEEKMYQRQIFKHFLSNKILIDPNQKNILTTSTLQDLFMLEEANRDRDTETASLFKCTKVNVTFKDKYKNISSSTSKSEEIRKQMREISKKLPKATKKSKVIQIEKVSMQRYEHKSSLAMNIPKIYSSEINLVDDKLTSTSFEKVTSEIEINNSQIKKDYEEDFIQHVINNRKQIPLKGEITNESQMENKYSRSDKILSESENAAFKRHEITKEGIKYKNSNTTQNNKKLKRRYSELEFEIDNLLAVKKMKNEKHKEITNDDDYILTKLFANAIVKNALLHEAVVGLSEKEKRYRLKEEALEKVKLALQAIKCSSSLS